VSGRKRLFLEVARDKEDVEEAISDGFASGTVKITKILQRQ
jgi:hypothetical protein